MVNRTECLFTLSETTRQYPSPPLQMTPLYVTTLYWKTKLGVVLLYGQLFSRFPVFPLSCASNSLSLDVALISLGFTFLFPVYSIFTLFRSRRCFAWLFNFSIFCMTFEFVQASLHFEAGCCLLDFPFVFCSPPGSLAIWVCPG